MSTARRTLTTPSFLKEAPMAEINQELPMNALSAEEFARMLATQGATASDRDTGRMSLMNEAVKRVNIPLWQQIAQHLRDNLSDLRRPVLEAFVKNCPKHTQLRDERTWATRTLRDWSAPITEPGFSDSDSVLPQFLKAS